MSTASPTKSTGGGGFVFENRVVASFLAAMLAQAAIEPDLGELVEVATQQAVAGWTGGLDDIVLTFERISERSDVALSVKSYPAFTSRTAPRELVVAAWRHILGHDVRKLGDREFVGMAVAPLPQRVRAPLRVLLESARLSPAETLEARLETPGAAPDSARQIYASLACPPELAAGEDDEDTRAWRVLQRLRVIEFDLDAEQSLALEAALSRCRLALESGDANEAQSLWALLLSIGDELRPAGGSLSRDQLLARVAKLHSLRERPDHRSDLRRLAQISTDERERVHDTIGTIRLERDEARMDISAALAASPTVALVGPAGIGKSGLTKRIADDFRSALVVWLAADRLDARTLPEISSALGLQHALDDLLLDHPAQAKFLVIDGLDRASPERLSTLALLARRLVGARTNWNVLITARAEEWRRIEIDLLAASYPASWIARVDLSEPSPDELDDVWDAHPELRLLSLRPQLRPLLLKPKVLDLMARNASRRPDVTTWVGESDLVEWFWQEEVDRGPRGIARGEALKRLAERQADELETATPLSVIDTTGLDELRQDELVRVKDERVSFAHDLYGDWARERVLVGNSGNLVGWLSPRLASPPWHRAARLYALTLIEQGRLDDWRKLVRDAATADPVLSDLVVEAAIFAADPAAVLELIWDDLATDKGKLLRRLLNRLLFVGTLPDPTMAEWASSFGEGIATSEAATLNRIPFPLYWPPVLRFLASHRDAVVQIALAQVAEVCDTWLRRGDRRFPQRREAAEIALAGAERLYSAWRRGTWLKDEIDTKVYRAALAGGEELPDEVGDLALRLVRRRDVDDVQTHETEWGITRELPPPWPLGPSERIEEGVEKVVLSPDGLIPLFSGAPQSAREALVATLIQPPRLRDFGDWLMPDEKLGFETRLDWHVPTWFRGPFIAALRASPDEGGAAVLALVSFATQRSQELQGEAEPSSVNMQLRSGMRELPGDAGLFAWYRDAPGAPDAVVVGLMALERYLYEQIDADQPVDAFLERVLSESTSVATLGVLVAVGCYRPALLEGPLEPLLLVPELLVWDRHQKWGEQLQGQMVWQIGALNDPEVLRRVALEWHTMPHRRRTLEEIALRLMLGREHDALFDRFLHDLRANAEQLADRGMPFERLLTIFDRERYVAVRDEHGNVYLTIPPTEEQVAESKTVEEETARSLAALEFVPRCRRILDGEVTLGADELAAFWDALREREATEKPGDFEPGFLEIEDALCGGIAVLLAFHRDWVGADTERERWCRETILRILENPPPRHFMTSDAQDDGAWAWDRFAAQAIAILLAENPSSPDLRLAAARFASFDRYATVATLFRVLSEQRDELGETFPELCELALWWATLRPTLQHGHDNVELRAQLGHAAEMFARGSVVLRAEWDELVAVAKEEPDRKRRRRKRSRPVADITAIEAVHAWIPGLEDARNEEERAEWISRWRRLLAFELGILGVSEIDADESEVEGSLYSFDRWLLGALARTTLEMRDNEDPASIWQPLLNLGDAAPRWVDAFLDAWLRYGFIEQPASSTFLSRWRQMIEHALASPRWKLDGWRYSSAELWHALLGLDWTEESLWTPEQQPTVLALKDLYERWASEALTGKWSAERLARFLWRTPAGRTIQLDGVIWLDRAAATGLWDEPDVHDELARLLDAAWNTQSAQLGSSTNAGMAFRRLLRRLAEEQNALALALIGRIGGG
ncbi:MAG: hypothetical protein M3546_11195 [Actinomycetota bacterium]|nr:hypothetical protein [Actinomycetota bacterium]